MAITASELSPLTTLTTGFVTQYTLAAPSTKAEITTLLVHNYTAVAQTCVINVVPFGGTATDANEAFDLDIEGRETRQIEFHGSGIVLATVGDFIQAKSDSATAINLALYGFEES